MRERADIEVEANTCHDNFKLRQLQLEVLLDIRDLLPRKQSKQICRREFLSQRWRS